MIPPAAGSVTPPPRPGGQLERRGAVAKSGYPPAVSRVAFLSRALFIGAAVWLTTFVGCSDESAGTGGAGPIVHEGVVYEGGTTPDALDALLGAPPTHDPTKTAVLEWPSNNEILSPDHPQSFCWVIGEPTGLFQRLLEGLPLGGVRSAHAQAYPVNGPAYLVTFAGPDGALLHRAFTNATVYVPSLEVWGELTAADVPITVTVTWADFQDDAIIAGGGPWQGKPITVTIRRPL